MSNKTGSFKESQGWDLRFRPFEDVGPLVKSASEEAVFKLVDRKKKLMIVAAELQGELSDPRNRDNHEYRTVACVKLDLVENEIKRLRLEIEAVFPRNPPRETSRVHGTR